MTADQSYMARAQRHDVWCWFNVMKEEGKTHLHPTDMFLCRLNQPAANYVQSRVLDGGATQDSERGHVCGVVWSRLVGMFFLNRGDCQRPWVGPIHVQQDDRPHFQLTICLVYADLV